VPESLYRAVDEGLLTFIDLSEATFLDTVTLGIILEAVRRSRSATSSGSPASQTSCR